MKIIKWIWREAKGIRALTAITSLLGICSIGASLFFVWITKHIVDIATGVSDADFRTAGWLMVATLVGQLMLSAASKRVGIIASTRFSCRLRGRMFNHLMRAQWRGREPFHTADSIGRLGGDVSTLSGFATGTLPGTIITIVQLLAAFVFLLCLDPRMAWMIAVIMPLALALSKLYTKRARRLTRRIREEETEINRTMQESLRHRKLMMSLPEEGGCPGRFDKAQTSFFRLILKRNDISIFASTAVTFGFMTGYAVAFLWCASGLIEGTVTFGLMTAFLQLVNQVQRPVVDLAGRVPQYINAGVAAERLDQLRDLPEEREETAQRLKGTPGLSLSDVSYSYPDGKDYPVENFTYNFRPGTMTAIAGNTGAGKTTILMLMLGMAKPQKGEVKIYSGDVSVDAGKGARVNMVYVPQGNSLVSGTVRENLQMARAAGDEATEAEMEKALHDACAEFIFALPKGLDTFCGESGGGFSEGEAQRIAVARGLLGRGRILLLDEPTSALDPQTSGRLIEHLRDEVRDRTIVIVTHRSDTMALCDATIKINSEKMLNLQRFS